VEILPKTWLMIAILRTKIMLSLLRLGCILFSKEVIAGGKKELALIATGTIGSNAYIIICTSKSFRF
jgi:hypothetical protein